MPILSVIKNTGPEDAICFKVPEEDFNTNSKLIVSEYEDALFVQNGAVELVTGPTRNTLSTKNYPFLTKLGAHFISGGVSAYNCKIYYVNRSHHLELKWGTSSPVRLIDPVWQIEVHVQARGSYSVVIEDSKQFFLKLVGPHNLLEVEELVENFRSAFVQDITDAMAEYLISAEKEVLVVCNQKKDLARNLKEPLGIVLKEYGMRLLNFYIETMEIPDGDSSMQRIREIRIRRQEKEFEREQSIADTRVEYGLRRESAQTERYESGQRAQADYERIKIRDQDGDNGWARQETSEILHEAAANEGVGGILTNMGVSAGLGAAIGNMAANMADLKIDEKAAQNRRQKQICPVCNAVMSADMKFCGQCGTPLKIDKKFCRKCGEEIPVGMKFCGQCGTKVEEV